jgi:hypothetical protein
VKLYSASAMLLVLLFGSSPAIGQLPRPAAPTGKSAAGEHAPAALPEKPPDAEKPAAESHGSHIEVIIEPEGKLALAVHYPWHVHRRASVEVELRADKEAQIGHPHPLGFVAEWMKGDMTNAVYAAREQSAAGSTSKTMTLKGREFDIRGSLNALGKRGVCVVAAAKRPLNEGLLAKHIAEEGPRTVFYLLGSWAVDDSTLRLELPHEEFSKPGTLHVWFLREGDVVWSESVHWPGGEK